MLRLRPPFPYPRLQYGAADWAWACWLAPRESANGPSRVGFAWISPPAWLSSKRAGGRIVHRNPIAIPRTACFRLAKLRRYDILVGCIVSIHGGRSGDVG